MADYTIATGSNHNVLNWERKVEREALKMAKFVSFFGKDANSAIRVVDDLKKGAGDTVYHTLIMNLTGSGVAGDATLVGSEETFAQHRTGTIINQLRNAVKSAGRITEQRTFINFREEAGQVLAKWGADVLDKWSCNQLAGNTGETDTNLTGMQATTAPTSAAGNSRIIYGPGALTTEASLSVTSTSAFQLTMIDKAVAWAETATPALQPFKTRNGMRFGLMLHPFQIYYLKTDATAARVTWYDYNKALLQGGAKVDPIGNPEWGALGEYNNVLIYSDSRVPLAPSTTRVRRGIFFGAQAATCAWGRDSGDQNRFKYDEEIEDYQNRTGIAIRLIGGLKKNVFNSIDFGTIVMSSYAKAP